MLQNPFLEFNSQLGLHKASTPNFSKKKLIASMRISEEAEQTLLALVQKFTVFDIVTAKSLSNLLEQIGLHALILERPENQIDPESNVSTEDCRESGYMDAMEGNPQNFLAMFGQQLTDVYQAAYMRGYLEGSHIRNYGKDK